MRWTHGLAVFIALAGVSHGSEDDRCATARPPSSVPWRKGGDEVVQMPHTALADSTMSQLLEIIHEAQFRVCGSRVFAMIACR